MLSAIPAGIVLFKAVPFSEAKSENWLSLEITTALIPVEGSETVSGTLLTSENLPTN